MPKAYHTIDHLPDRYIALDGQDYLFFSGTAYLGIPQNSQFRQLMYEAMMQYGTVFGSSRNGNLRLGIYEEAEEKLAAFAGAPAALTLSSGMMAGQAVVNWLKLPSAWPTHGLKPGFIYAPHTHPALWHEPILTLPAGSFTNWVTDLLTQQPLNQPITILANSIDAVRSEAFFFDWVSALPADIPITLVIDDSHGLGLLGEKGQGIWHQIQQHPGIRLVVTASLAKAMGLPGGVVLSDAATIAAIRHTAFFGGCSPIAPAYLQAFTQADALYQQAQQKLRNNIRLAEQLLLPTNLFRQAPGYPVFYTDYDDLYPFLLQQGICIYSFAYPTLADKPNTRIVISAFHEPEDISKLGDAIQQYVATIRLPVIL